MSGDQVDRVCMACLERILFLGLLAERQSTSEISSRETWFGQRKIISEGEG